MAIDSVLCSNAKVLLAIVIVSMMMMMLDCTCFAIRRPDRIVLSIQVADQTFVVHLVSAQ